MSEVSRSDQHPLQDRCSPPSLTSSCLIIFASGMREEVEKHVSGAPSVTPSLLALLANHICRTTLFRSLLAASPLRRWGRRWWSQRERWGEIKEGNFERARGSKDEKLKILVEDSRGCLWGKQRSAVGRPRSTHMQTLSELSNIYPASEKNMWTAGYCTHILDVGQRPSMSKFVTFRKWKPLFLRDCVNIMTLYIWVCFGGKDRTSFVTLTAKFVLCIWFSLFWLVVCSQSESTIPIEMLSEWLPPLILKILS